MRTLVIAFTIASLVVPAIAQDPAPLSEASPLQTGSDAFMGDYQGTMTTEGQESPLAAQIIALGDGRYDIHLVPALYDGSEQIGSLMGKRDGDAVSVRGVVDGVRWRGAIDAGTLTGKMGDAGTFTLEQAEPGSPSMGAKPPEGAVVLFDGSSTGAFVHTEDGAPCRWLLLENGAMEVRAGGIVSKEVFNDQRVHLEFRTPLMADKRGQDRGNSGVYLQGRYEVQILDSYGLEGKDNEAGGIYENSDPRINMCYPPLQWQTYDIEFRAPRFDAEGNKTEHAKLTVWHNGVLVQENVEVPEFTRAHVGGVMSEPGPLHLQDHGNPVWYRNIWVERL